MTQGYAGIHRRLLDHLLDGVMVVERGGTVTLLNPAAARILGVSPEEVAGRTFTELFIAREEFVEFSDLILDAVNGEGEGGRQVVTLRSGDAARTLSVAISYIKSRRDGAGGTVALIAVFSDITELRELRETELRMAKAVEAQHAELQTAYRQVEERNEELAAMLKKVQVARVLATAVVIGVFLAAGAYVWPPLNGFGSAFGPSVVSQADAGVAKGLRTIVVEPRQMRADDCAGRQHRAVADGRGDQPDREPCLGSALPVRPEGGRGRPSCGVGYLRDGAGAPSGAGEAYRCVGGFRDRTGLEERPRNDRRAAGVRAGSDCT